MTALKVVDCYPAGEVGKRPMCTGKLSPYVAEQNYNWRKRGMLKPNSMRVKRKVADDVCGNLARYKINGQWYCRKHGALAALDLVAEKVRP